MKPHLVVRFAPNAALPRGFVPFWGDFIRDKARAVYSLFEAFDRQLFALNLPFWVTREYQPRGTGWSLEETAAGLDRVFRIVLQRDAELPAELVSRIRLRPEFESVRPIRVERTDLPTTARAQTLRDPRFDRSRDVIGLREAHLFGAGDRRIRVAVLDTGVDSNHPELRSSIAAAADFVHLDGLDTSDFIGDVTEYDSTPEDEVGHGTHVSGIIVGTGVNMPPGVASGCSLIAVRTLATLRTPDGPAGAGIVDNINVAFKWAVDQGAHVINASLGIKHTGGGLPHDEVIRYAISRGVTVVAASGNDGTSEKYYPGALPGVIAVGATDSDDSVASFSSYGAPVALVAPGTNILSSDVRGGYKLATGTSQAAPFVAGAAALLRSQAARRGVQLTDADIKAILMHTSDKDSPSSRTPRRGYGRLNLLDACRLLNHTLDERGLRQAA